MSHASSEIKMSNHRRPQVRWKLFARSSPKWTLLKLTIATLVVHAITMWQQVACQCPVNTMTSFERIHNVQVKDTSLLTVLYSAPNTNSLNRFDSAELSRQLGVSSLMPLVPSSIYQVATPITAECNNRCRRNAKCRAYLVNYERQTCYSVEHGLGSSASPSNGLIKTPTPIQLIASHERTSYFEKVCLNLPAVECERAWVFERVLGYHVHGHDDKIIDRVPSRLRCQEHCLNERQFKCRSGEYDQLLMQCRLSSVDRHLKPLLFRETTPNIDYFENQCSPMGSQCDAYDRYEDSDLGRAEIMRPANSSDDCQKQCTQVKAFICRSALWNPMTGKCYLNSATFQMFGGQDKLISAPGIIYYQRNDCIDLRLDCDFSAMTLNLRTNEPFRGRMYVREDPNSCEMMGRSSLSSSLSIPFNSPTARCVQRELPSRFSSVVVVQQHPLIQRKSDRYIKLVCDFQTTNKTINSHYNVVQNPWASTAVINSTSLAPKIKLRITDKFGNDVTGAKLGDELNLRIEAEGESVYDMVARSVLAKSGKTDESIMLIDHSGCPTDSRIFPPLEKVNRRTIVGKFDAFKFSSDLVVRFQVDVQFCLNRCPPMSCEADQQQDLSLLNSNAQQLAGDQTDTYRAGLNDSSTPTPTSSSTSTSTVATNSIQQQIQSNMLGADDQSVNNFNLPNSPLNSHQLGPATNQPLAGQPDGQSIFELTKSQQTFEPRSAKSEAQTSNQSRQRHQHHLDGNAIDATGDPQMTSERPAVSRANERRRRSAEPMPISPSHVPLQREIIVEASSTSSQSKHATGSEQQRKATNARQDNIAKRGRAQTDTRFSAGKLSAKFIALHKSMPI